MKGEFVMKQERMTIEKMRELYPNEWLFITDYVLDNYSEVIEGVVLAHSADGSDIDKVSAEFKGHAAIEYTGDLFPEGMVML